MLIKRARLGEGNLTFKRRKSRRSLIVIGLYLAALFGTLAAVMNAETLQPRIAAIIEPPPPTTSPNELVQQGQAAYQEGDMTGAASYYAQAVAIDPQNVDIQVDYVRLLTLSAQLDQAIAAADQLILLAPEDPRGYAMKARALDWHGDYDQSVLMALRSIELDPDYAPAHAYLAEAYADLGRLRQAREQAEMAIQLDPYNVDARRNYAYVLEFYGDYEGAIQQYIQALQLHPNMLDLWYGLARNYRGAGLSDQAIATFNQIAIRTPEDPLIYVELGKTYFEIRDDDAAQEVLQHAVDLVCADCPLYTSDEILAPGFFDQERELPDQIYMPAWTRLGQVYFTRRNYESAIEIFEEAIAWGEANDVEVPLEAYYVTASAYYYLDRCYLAIPRDLEALAVYENREMNDSNALLTMRRLFVLCRDYAGQPYVHVGEGFVNGYPEWLLPEPDVIIERGTGTGGDNGGGNSGGDYTPPAP